MPKREREKEMKKYKYSLVWGGKKDTPMRRASAKYMEDFPLWKDSKAKVVNFSKYQQLVKSGMIEPPQEGWKIGEGEVGVICETYFSYFMKTWEIIRVARSDFEAGWAACEKTN